MKNEFEFEATLTLNHPLTEEDMDILTDVDFDHTDRVWFYTKHGKEVEFVKVTRCKDCKHWKGNDEPIPWSDDNIFIDVPCETKPTDFCSRGERKEDEEDSDEVPFG